MPEHRVIRTEEREQSRFSAQRSRHLIHDAARRARDCVLAQLAERRELRAALDAVERNVREDGERADATSTAAEDDRPPSGPDDRKNRAPLWP